MSAVAKAHDQLFHGADVEHMDLGKYIEAICQDVDANVSHCIIHTDARYGIEAPTDRAISVAMIVNELITNVAKYAYNGNTDGQIWVTLADAGRDHVATSVRDEGAGLPADFNLDKPNGLGMRSSRLS